MFKKNLLTLLIFLATYGLCGKSEEPIAIGNFALPTSQQPSPLFSFGQNIVDKGDKFAFTTLSCITGKHQHFLALTPSFLYGISDTFSILFNLPIALSYKEEDTRSRGLADFYVDAEYAFYQSGGPTWFLQGTVVGGIWFPTGSPNSVPPVGAGTAVFFIGTTCSYTTIKWYSFTSCGVSFPTNERKSQVSTQVYFEGGLGLNLADTVDSIILGLLEIDGIHTAKNNGRQGPARAAGKLFAPFFEGTILFLGPSLFCSNEHWVMQAGIQFPVLQPKQRMMPKLQTRSSFYIAYKF